MLTIIKRSGRKEPFELEKTKQSLAASSDEAKEPLNESDLRRIMAELKQILEGKELVTTQQIVVIITGLLYTKGFFGVLDHYLNYRRNRIN